GHHQFHVPGDVHLVGHGHRQITHARGHQPQVRALVGGGHHMHVDVHDIGDDFMEDAGDRTKMALDVRADLLDVRLPLGRGEVLLAAVHENRAAARADVVYFNGHVLLPG